MRPDEDPEVGLQGENVGVVLRLVAVVIVVVEEEEPDEVVDDTLRLADETADRKTGGEKDRGADLLEAPAPRRWR